MTVNRTTLLDLPLPVTGTESGTWGDVTNNGLSEYVDIAVAGMTSLTSSDFTAGALTIANTQGDSGSTNIAAGSAQYATLKTSSLAANSTITAPASNRSYRVINADSTYSLTIKASGQTGVTFLPGTTGIVAFNGTDYEIVGVVGAASSTDNAIPKFDGTTGQIIQNTGVTIDDSNNVSGVAQLNATTVDTTNLEVTNIKAKDGTASIAIADSTGVVSFSNNATFGDNDKAVFGTGGDLEIYHDGSNSYISEPSGTGDLIIRADNFQVQRTNGESYIAATANDAVNLYYDNSTKLATTNTGIDVTGSVVSDGASLDGAVVINDAGADVDFRVESDTNANAFFLDGATGYLGINTSSPPAQLHIRAATDATFTDGLRVSRIGSDSNQYISANMSGGTGNIIVTETTLSLPTLRFLASTDGSTATERARFTSGGYFKATSDGNYYGVAGNYHEFNQHIDSDCVLMDSGNASLTNPVLSQLTTRAASSAFTFFRSYSGSGSDTEFILRGDGNGYADGTWNNNGADYAEYFESANGQALTLGATVVLDGNKVREATEQDPASAIIGVVRPKEPSKASMVIGNTAWNKWANKYLTDDFDRYVMEDHDVVGWEEQVLEKEATEAVEAVVDEDGNEVSPAIPAQEATYKTISHSYESHNIPEGITVPEDATVKTHDDKGNKFQHYKLNPEWNPDSEYVNRENRAEWNIIGLLGQVKILKGQPVGDRWIKMRDISETVEEWFIR